MKNEIQVLLFKDSDCDICKLMQQELINNPPAANIIIINVNRDGVGGYPYRNRVKVYPTIVICTYPYPKEIAWFEGFVSTEVLDEHINNFINKFNV